MIFSYVGLGQVSGLIALAFLAIKRAKPYVFPTVTTIFATGTFLAQGIKSVVPRLRPSNLQYAHPAEPHLMSSFPSGHTTTAFAAATMVFLIGAKRGRFEPGLVLFVLAILVGLSRIYRGVHWPSDVLGGALLGIGGSLVIYPVWNAIQTRFEKSSPHPKSE
jgi:undecaprenyl-diphosphatase